MLNFLNKIFGSKSDKDLKTIQPLVSEILSFYEKFKNLSIDELRNKTNEFRALIEKRTEKVQHEINDLKSQADSSDDVHLKESNYAQIDKKEKEIVKIIEEVLNEILPQAFALIKETSRRLKENKTLTVKASDNDRQLSVSKGYLTVNGDQCIWQNTWTAAGNQVTWDMVHYDVQLIGGIVLHQGKIAEMATGEGKTLVATLPVYLNALAGKGVHVVTVNNYLSKRDAEWNGPLFEFLGLTVDCIDKYEPNSPERRKAYQADITYGTNNEFGFDYLRDNMARTPEELVQRKHHFAIVDEVDSVLVDDARTPLIISGPTPKGNDQEFQALKPRVEKLFNAQKNYLNTVLSDAKRLLSSNEKEGGLALLRCHRGLPKNKALIKFLSEQGTRAILQKTENHYMQDQGKEMHKVDTELYFVIDEKNNSVELTEKGIDLITSSGEDSKFFVLPDVGAEIAEIDASIMDGKTMGAGAVAGVRRVKNPITAAWCVMMKSKHVLLTGAGADKFAKQCGCEIVDTAYFFDQKRWDQLQKVKKQDQIKLDHSSDTTGSIDPVIKDKKFGTVGAVALDQYGNLAAGTSTGGMTNKKFGRVGDAPIIGAGTYANNKQCGISCTGHGEYFIKNVVAYDVYALMEYKGYDVNKAATTVVMEKLKEINAEGGLIAMDKNGNISMPFNTSGMYRGYMKSNGEKVILIYK